MEGVHVLDLVDFAAKRLFQRHSYNDGADLTSAHLTNHVPDYLAPWGTNKVQVLVDKGCVTRWADVIDVSVYPKPHMVLPRGVEPKKPRLIWDARWLNLMRRHLPFTMDGVGKVAQCAWKGAH